MGELNILISLIAAEGSGMCSPQELTRALVHGKAPSFRIQTTSQTLLGASGTASAGNIHPEHHPCAQGSGSCCWDTQGGEELKS